MTAKPVVRRARARADVELVVDHYTNEAGADVAFKFIDALEQVCAFTGEVPAARASRWSNALNLPRLKTMRA